MNKPGPYCKRVTPPGIHALLVAKWRRPLALLCLCMGFLGRLPVASAQNAPEPPGPDPSAPSVLTERSDYAPGETALISGSGFASGESVLLQVLHADGTPDSGSDHLPWAVTADADGSFQATWHVCEDDCLGATLLLSALGQASGLSAQGFFTDAGPGCLAGEVDLSFDPGSSIDSTVRSLAVQSDGKVLIGGQFTAVNGGAHSFIARLNADGSADTTFLNGLSGANNTAFSVAMQSDGKIVIGGAFTTVNGVTCNRIARLNADGSTDNTFLNGMDGADGSVISVAIQSDGKVVIGGAFTTVNGVTCYRIARLNADGSTDNTFLNGMDGASAIIRALALQSDGKVVIGGELAAVNGVTRKFVARLNADGSTDNTFLNEMEGVNGPVQSVAVQDDGKVLIGGQFTTVNGVARNFIARLNADGSTDNTFLNGMDGANSIVQSVAIQSDGKLLIGGVFTTVNGLTRSRIARLNTDGSLDTAFLNGLTGADNVVFSIALQTDGEVLIGGDFTSVNGVTRSRLARLNADGSLDTSFQNGLPGANASVISVATQSDGKVVTGGSFTTVNALTRNRVARFNADGSLDTAFLNGLAGANSTVQSVSVQSDDKILIGGQFTTVNSVARNHIARMNADGSLDTTFLNALAGANLTVNSVTTQTDGRILIGGLFTTINGVTRNRIARMNADGSLDTTFQNGLTGASDTVSSVAVQPDGKVLFGGQFRTVNGVVRNFIARLEADGSLDTTFLNGPAGANGGIQSVSVQSDGKVLIGGNFSTVNGLSRNRIARLNADGSLDTTFLNGLTGANNSLVSVITAQADGNVLIGGNFTTLNGVARNRIARLNTDGNLDTSFLNGLTGANNIVNSLLVQSDGKILIGGAFTAINNLGRDRVARLNGGGGTPKFTDCPANINVETGPGRPTCDQVASWTPPLVTGSCTPMVVTSTHTPGASFPLGITTVTYTATDTANSLNIITCNFTVTVVDTTPPATPVLATVAGECSTTVTVPATTDACAGTVTGTTSDPLVYNTQGTFIVRWTFNDGNGNSTIANQTVIVKDTIAPAAPVLAAATGECSATVTVPTATDTCAGTVTGATTDPLVYNTQGTFIVHWTFSDGNGNGSTANQTVIVKDTIAPAAPVLATVTGECSATVTAPTTTDTCAGTVTGTTSDPLVYNTQGTFTVHWTFNDGNGNSSTANQTVIVKDITPPTITCPANLSVGCRVERLAAVNYPAPIVSDNCDAHPTITCTPASGSASFAVGVNTVTCTATDTAGKTATCSFTVTRAALGFTGFLSPIGGEVGKGTGGSFADPLRAFKLGSTIPVKFQAGCSGSPVATGAHTLQVTKYSNSVDSDPAIDATPTDAATTGNQFLLTDAASGEWHYNLNTKPLSVGTWKLTATLSDGTVHEVWITIKK